MVQAFEGLSISLFHDATSASSYGRSRYPYIERRVLPTSLGSHRSSAMDRAGDEPEAFYFDDRPNLRSEEATPAEGIKSKRKQMLLSLLKALQELSSETDVGIEQKPSFEYESNVATVEEHLQKVGAEAFNEFERRMINLDKELRNFANAARQLGSSVGILSSSSRLRERLDQILFLFRENAADLFPGKVQRRSRKGGMNPSMRRKVIMPHATNPTVLEDLDAEALPCQLEGFADDFNTFLGRLNEFPEFTDEGCNASIVALEGDLKYWSSCLQEYEGQFKYPAVQRYLHDLTTEMGEHLDTITFSLSTCIETGVPAILSTQKHDVMNFLTLSAVATFFSVVTATAMQFSFGATETNLANSVNGFWFTSLVFSAGAAANLALGFTWKQATYHSPGHRIPWWVRIWMKWSPLVFLVLSVSCFSIGLALFAYSSGQHHITSIVITVFSACIFFGLTSVSCWFAGERWVYNRYNGQRWLADVLSETTVSFKELPGIALCPRVLRNSAHKVSYWARRVHYDFRDHFSAFVKFVSSKLSARRMPIQPVFLDDSESQLPNPPIMCYGPSSTSLQDHDGGSHATDSAHSQISERAPSGADGLQDPTGTSDTGLSAPTSPCSVSPARTRFRNLVHSVIKLRGVTNNPTNPTPSRRQRAMSDTKDGSYVQPTPGMNRGARVAALIPKLERMEPSHDLAAHQALVRHLQFSPNGKFLATSSWDRTAVIFRVGEEFTPYRVLAHPQGFVGQVTWSPKDGQTLLTKMNRGIKVWTEDGVCRKTINRNTAVQSIAWLPGGESFMSVEGSYVTQINLDGTVLNQFQLQRVILHDVAVTLDCQRMLCVGTLTASAHNLRPQESRAEKQIIVYNLEKNEIESRVPVLHEVRDVTMARNGDFALVSYEDKAPPQLWRLDKIKDTTRLSLQRTYMPKAPVDFAGPSYFGGRQDQLVLCAGKGGDIHIWDRGSAVLLHHLHPRARGGGELTCVAWNPAADPFMFAVGSSDGGVQIWSTSPQPPSSVFEDEAYPPSRETSPHPMNTPRTASPSLFDPEYRAESPSANTDSGDDDSDSSSEAMTPAALARTVQFLTQ